MVCHLLNFSAFKLLFLKELLSCMTQRLCFKSPVRLSFGSRQPRTQSSVSVKGVPFSLFCADIFNLFLERLSTEELLSRPDVL